MLGEEIIEKWLLAFASNISPQIMNKHIIANGNHLWHIFTWGNVPAVAGDEARKVFDTLLFEKAIVFYGGYSNQIENIQECGKFLSTRLDELGDVYVVDENFKWTYVHTHESQCGPYFCRNRDLI